MANFSAIVPGDFAAQANADLDALGYGPRNFSVPAKSAGATGADWVGLHCWDIPDFRAAVEALDPAYGVVILEGDGDPNFGHLCAQEALQWVQPTGNEPGLPMIGDQRQHDGKTWESLVDYNVWEPPVAWREVVSSGFPAWVQPTGAHDAYALGAKVSYNGQNWESTTPANVWQPGVFGWVVIP
jgi:hypothetical protein